MAGRTIRLSKVVGGLWHLEASEPQTSIWCLLGRWDVPDPDDVLYRRGWTIEARGPLLRIFSALYDEGHLEIVRGRHSQLHWLHHRLNRIAWANYDKTVEPHH